MIYYKAPCSKFSSILIPLFLLGFSSDFAVWTTPKFLKLYHCIWTSDIISSVDNIGERNFEITLESFALTVGFVPVALTFMKASIASNFDLVLIWFWSDFYLVSIWVWSDFELIMIWIWSSYDLKIPTCHAEKFSEFCTDSCM